MDEQYICDDRGVFEEVQRIREMTDKEFEEYMKASESNTEPAQQ